MKAGKLRHYVTFQRKTVTGTGDRGQPVVSWSDYVADVPAEVVPLSGRKLELARQLVPLATHQVRIRFLDLTTKDRMTFGGKTYNVESIDNTDSRTLETILLVVEAP